MAMNPCVLAINIGSSGLKASLFATNGSRSDMKYQFEGKAITLELDIVFKQLFAAIGNIKPDLIVHLFVHGGDIADAIRWLDITEIKRLNATTCLAPLHQSTSLLGVSFGEKYFNVPQAASFDTAFHRTMSPLAKVLPIPASENIHRYGFHGLSYAYLATQLPALIGKVAHKNVVFAHLGAGASLCLMKNLQSVDTTMGYTPAGGVCMATRSGDLDPGVMLALARRYDADRLSNIVNHQMGLLALSNGESADMQTLINSNSHEAKFAVDYFCRQVTAAIGSLAAKAGGIDALVFSGGIGEHAAIVREQIVAPLAFMHIRLDLTSNIKHMQQINMVDSIPIFIIPTDEEIVMQRLACNLLKESNNKYFVY